MGGPRTRTVEGWVGPLFPTEIRVTLRCKEHDVGSEFEIGYFEWGAKRDVKKYYGYTEEDSAIAMQVGDWKWSQEKSKEVRDFYEERFGHKITEEEVQENATNTVVTAAASEAEAAEGQVTVGGEVQGDPESVNGQDELGLFGEALFYHDYGERGEEDILRREEKLKREETTKRVTK